MPLSSPLYLNYILNYTLILLKWPWILNASLHYTFNSVPECANAAKVQTCLKVDFIHYQKPSWALQARTSSWRSSGLALGALLGFVLFLCLTMPSVHPSHAFKEKFNSFNSLGWSLVHPSHIFATVAQLWQIEKLKSTSGQLGLQTFAPEAFTGDLSQLYHFQTTSVIDE